MDERKIVSPGGVQESVWCKMANLLYHNNIQYPIFIEAKQGSISIGYDKYHCRLLKEKITCRFLSCKRNKTVVKQIVPAIDCITSLT